MSFFSNISKCFGRSSVEASDFYQPADPKTSDESSDPRLAQIAEQNIKRRAECFKELQKSEGPSSKKIEPEELPSRGYFDDATSAEKDILFPMPISNNMQRPDDRKDFHFEDSFQRGHEASPSSPAPLVLTEERIIGFKEVPVNPDSADGIFFDQMVDPVIKNQIVKVISPRTRDQMIEQQEIDIAGMRHTGVKKAVQASAQKAISEMQKVIGNLIT